MGQGSLDPTRRYAGARDDQGHVNASLVNRALDAITVSRRGRIIPFHRAVIAEEDDIRVREHLVGDTVQKLADQRIHRFDLREEIGSVVVFRLEVRRQVAG